MVEATTNVDRLCEQCEMPFVTSMADPGRFCINCVPCAECKLPPPENRELSLHLESCSRHNEETCQACMEVSHGDSE